MIPPRTTYSTNSADHYMGLNVALIGASGKIGSKIGSKIAEELLSRGYTVTGIARRP